jgi:aldehyde:ferredoxin oxidoreductase
MGLTAWIDLSTGTVSRERTDPALIRDFLGGRGLGAALLYRNLGDASDPFAPENPLIFATGPFTGTPWPAGARYHVTFHSPLTASYGYANSGGFFGAALARAGYDVLSVSGRADHPVYLEVTPDGITLHPADHLWGQGTQATHKTLATQGARVACIGPAGEQQVRLAAILNDGSRAAARCGGGAVMGSKGLKAIVVRGRVDQALPPAYRARARQAMQRVRDYPGLADLREWGTVHLAAARNQIADFPARNHQEGQVPRAKLVDAEAIARYTLKKKSCYACPIRCGRVTEVASGPHAGRVEGPEYGTLNALGPMCGIDDPEVILHANRLCNDLGLDTVSTGVVIAFAMECYQRCLINDAQFSLEWGDAPTVLGLVVSIALRQGLGDLLAEGVRRAAQAIGGEAPRYAMHVKGLELPRQEPRIAKGVGLGHVTANRGADHLYALPTIDLAGNLDAARRQFPAEIVSRLMDTDDEAYKPDLVVFGEHYCAVSDALGACKFTTAETYALHPEDLAAGLSALWSREVSSEEMLAAGERIVNLERLYNTRLGLSRADDRLPARFTEEPLPIYAFEGDGLSIEPVHEARLRDLDAMLARYYHLRGWDQHGIPTPEALERLNLGDWR